RTGDVAGHRGADQRNAVRPEFSGDTAPSPECLTSDDRAVGDHEVGIGNSESTTVAGRMSVADCQPLDHDSNRMRRGTGTGEDPVEALAVADGRARPGPPNGDALFNVQIPCEVTVVVRAADGRLERPGG